MAVTIRDVARLAAVSPASVCRALATPEQVRPETLRRVRNAASQLGYRPNPIARSLSTGRTGNLGLVVPDIANPFFPAIVKAAQARARELDCAVFLVDTDEDPRLEVELIRQLAKQVDGFLLCAARATADDLRSLNDGMPVVILNRRVGELPSVVLDNVDAARQAVTHLTALGHRRIAYLPGPRSSWVNRERLRGLRATVVATGAELVELATVSPTIEGGAAIADILLATGATAAIAYNDLVALGVLSRLRARGVLVPDQLSLVGFDDIPTAELVHPPLTTVAGAKTQLGRAGIDLLATLLHDEQPSGGVRRVLPTQLIVRGSTGPCPQQPC